ncbi:uncharacterized protein B0H64DRAFT_409516 [Chaetomium fimeti]|uniref:Uncharacterized protein n=1 Tax=Chaetomium fimeti TaxID=1854472 RepID=A0AAE0H857_9PEZI|nr:hypothetical protein B0H64DRAFT_409516 [Chaetomium fimeti]
MQDILHLGALPPELFDKIFLELDTIRDLANFIHTAHFVYRRFRTQRRTILFRVFQNELGPVLYDAGFLSVFAYSDPADYERYYDWIYFMAGVYRDMLPQNVLLYGKDQRVRDNSGTPTMEELTELCRTLGLINFMTDTYITTQLGSFNLAGGEGTPATGPPSRPERHRIMRAFYRRQIVSNAWASTRRPAHWDNTDSNAFSNMSTEEGRRLGLFAAFAPWEMQQIDHANWFIMRLCCLLVHHAGEAAEAGGGRKILPTQFGNLHAHLGHLIEYLRAHRGVAEAAIGDLQSRKLLIQDEGVEEEFMDRYEVLPLSSYWQNHRAQEFPDPGLDRDEQEGLLMGYFVGDNPDQVPFGWSDALRGHYVRWYGAALCDIPWLPLWGSSEKDWAHASSIELWRISGFTLWDQKRVEALKKLSRFEALQTGFVIDRP